MPHTHTHTHTQGPPLGKAVREKARERPTSARGARGALATGHQGHKKTRGGSLGPAGGSSTRGRTSAGKDVAAHSPPGGGRRVASGPTPRTRPGQTGCQRLAREVHGRTTRSSPSLETARRPPAEGQTDRTWLSPRWGSTEHEKECSPVGPARGPSGPWGVRGARRRSLGAVGAQLRDAEEGPVRRTEGGRPAGRSCTAPTRERAPEHFR